MEDRDKSKTAKAEDIIDLTLDMELTDESEVDIIDLTDIVDGPDEVPPPATAVIENPPASEQKTGQPSGGGTFSTAIEQEVEAAFDFVSSPILETAPREEPPSDHEGLMDKFSDIPQMVDDALDASDAPDSGAAAGRALDGGLSEDQAAETSGPDAARTEFALDEEDDEIIELTDIVDPSELEAEEDDEEIIELTDIVDASELEAAGLIMEGDDEIIELTDIVDPSELRVGAVNTDQDQAGVEDQEYEDLLETIDALDAEDLLVDIAEEASQEPESTSVAEDDEVPVPAADAAELDFEPGAPDEDQEYEDLLETIDALDAEDLLIDIAEEAVQEPESAPAADADEPEASAPDEDQEYAELLETIDSLDPDDLLVSVDEAGLLDTEESDPAATDDKDELLTLTEVLNRDAASRDQKPSAEGAGNLTREVEAETGREVRTLTEQEIEAAVERILKSKYAETIERLIANAVEKAVNREIETLKRTMLDDEGPA